VARSILRKEVLTIAIDKFKKLVKFSKRENENEYFEYTDDPDFEEVQPSGGGRIFAFSFYGALLTLGITFGANIAFNSGNGSGVEFGQGVTQIVNCQGDRNITLTPYAGFQNASGGGFFGLDSVILEDVHQSCVGKDFIVKVYNNSDDSPLVLTDSATSPGVYQTFTALRFYWSDSVTVSTLGGQYTDVELLNDTETADDFTNNITAFQITFDADTAANYADTRNVYKITIETAPHTGATS
jgi:hypothetical protein